MSTTSLDKIERLEYDARFKTKVDKHSEIRKSNVPEIFKETRTKIDGKRYIQTTKYSMKFSDTYHILRNQNQLATNQNALYTNQVQLLKHIEQVDKRLIYIESLLETLVSDSKLSTKPAL
jgi:hypothetical protein